MKQHNAQLHNEKERDRRGGRGGNRPKNQQTRRHQWPSESQTRGATTGRRRQPHGEAGGQGKEGGRQEGDGEETRDTVIGASGPPHKKRRTPPHQELQNRREHSWRHSQESRSRATAEGSSASMCRTKSLRRRQRTKSLIYHDIQQLLN